ncbi:cation:proton antiporter [Stappia sediminis]|uniref:cation:proton antiporter n=1 Tax=Stappia sediminis TaxID=2692190 RepID=UPI0028AC4655|nr:cation:proton antiporter [Stappia sediminis]
MLAVAVLAYGATANAFERTPFAGAFLFTAAGLALGPAGLSLLNADVEAEVLRTLAELALAFVLFTDAANTDMAELRHSLSLPRRLLLVGLPLVIAAGIVPGYLLFPELGLAGVAVLAIALAPTDAALGKAVVTDRAVPIRIRTALNVESGLNDGICVPFFLVALAVVMETVEPQALGQYALKVAVAQIGIGVGIGLVFSLLAVHAIGACSARGWISGSWNQVLVPALALACFATSQWAGGSGFIACFVAGLAFGALEKQHKDPLLEAAEGLGDALALCLWVLFGAVVVGPLMGQLTWKAAIYAALSLTVVRMVPVRLGLKGRMPGAKEKLFIGWFGPRGLASIVFAVMAIDADMPGNETISLVVSVTILMSVIAHGLSAKPLSRLLEEGERRETDTAEGL